MDSQQINLLIQLLKEKNVEFDTGLSNHEITEIETKYTITFPPDLKQFLQTELPIAGNFINWRLGLHSIEESSKITDQIDAPFEGMIFDIEYNNFWTAMWGEEPIEMKDKITVAKQQYHTYPKLIPIAGHRYIPSTPSEYGNPIFSVHQMDIIYYGYDLATYLAHEFDLQLPHIFVKPKQANRVIYFWSAQVEE